MDNEQIRLEHIYNEIMAALEDNKNAAFYRRVVERIPERFIYKALAEIKADLPEEIGNPRAYFAASMLQAASMTNVDITN